MNFISVDLIDMLVGDNEEKTTVLAERESTGQKEFNSAAQSGYKAECKLLIWNFEYNNQPFAETEGTRYSIYRTFRKRDDDRIELYLGTKVGVFGG